MEAEKDSEREREGREERGRGEARSADKVVWPYEGCEERTNSSGSDDEATMESS